jgi:hypothetical protein
LGGSFPIANDLAAMLPPKPFFFVILQRGTTAFPEK